MFARGIFLVVLAFCNSPAHAKLTGGGKWRSYDENPLENSIQMAGKYHANRLHGFVHKLNGAAWGWGETRASGSPGYVRAMNVILDTLSESAQEVQFHTQQFSHVVGTKGGISLIGPEGYNETVVSRNWNKATPPEGVTDQFNGVNASGNILLVQKGGCSIETKVKLATQHRALAVIVYPENDGTAAIEHLPSRSWGLLVPVGDNLTATLVVNSTADKREIWNIIAETRAGDPGKVIMLGAHLDSLTTRNGLNDNASGSALLLEALLAFVTFTKIPNKIRVAWWGAKENDMAGSRFYTSRLTKQQAKDIAFYFNYDVVGTRGYNYTVFADDDISKYGAKKLVSYIKTIGNAAER
ncbi:putative leucine aminopeptidase 2 [Purpureocillium lavendulum]|uniref:Peptide hydrolase n=1 Tax=Purpureocillium lavendulum TaxID=1247861 RepID=A0AB34G198_9HYPO|nr:putative leucine aminopeptidase 2 [Purpureocillium lavendulum]